MPIMRYTGRVTKYRGRSCLIIEGEKERDAANVRIMFLDKREYAVVKRYCLATVADRPGAVKFRLGGSGFINLSPLNKDELNFYNSLTGKPKPLTGDTNVN